MGPILRGAQEGRNGVTGRGKGTQTEDLESETQRQRLCLAVQTCNNPSTLEAEGRRISGQPGLHSKNLPQETKPDTDGSCL
jgi:hypothetical protein